MGRMVAIELARMLEQDIPHIRARAIASTGGFVVVASFKRGTGRIRDSRGYVPCCNYNAIESPRYLVRVTVDGHTMELENARQWELYKRLYLPAELVEHEEEDFDDSGLEQALIEHTGMILAEFKRFMSSETDDDEEEEKDETVEVIDVEEISLSYVDLLESSLEENSYESTWEAA